MLTTATLPLQLSSRVRPAGRRRQMRAGVQRRSEPVENHLDGTGTAGLCAPNARSAEVLHEFAGGQADDERGARNGRATDPHRRIGRLPSPCHAVFPRTRTAGT